MSYTWNEFSADENADRAKRYTAHHSLMVDMVQSEPYGLCVPPKFKKMYDRIKNLELRPDDVFMVTFPKAGSTWTQVG